MVCGHREVELCVHTGKWNDVWTQGSGMVCGYSRRWNSVCIPGSRMVWRYREGESCVGLGQWNGVDIGKWNGMWTQGSGIVCAYREVE